MNFLETTPIRGARALVILAALSAGGLSGCVSQVPCLAYTPQSFTRVVSLRGYGAVQMTEETLVCTQRADSELYAAD